MNEEIGARLETTGSHRRARRTVKRGRFPQAADWRGARSKKVGAERRIDRLFYGGGETWEKTALRGEEKQILSRAKQKKTKA